MINSVAPAANAFLAILFNLPPAIFNFLSLSFVLIIIISIIKILLGAKH